MRAASPTLPSCGIANTAVILGNYRSGLTGVDLNRYWNKANRIRHPTIAHCKRLVKSLHKTRNVILFIDFHGHSIMSNFGSAAAHMFGASLNCMFEQPVWLQHDGMRCQSARPHTYVRAVAFVPP